MKNLKPLGHNKLTNDLNKSFAQLDEFGYEVHEVRAWTGGDGHTHLAWLVTHPEKPSIRRNKAVLPIVVRETWQMHLNFQPDWGTAKAKLALYAQQNKDPVARKGSGRPE